MTSAQPDRVRAEPVRRRYDVSRRKAQAEQTRAQLLEAATRLFSATGWSGTFVRDIARAAGVSVETVYATFGSKLELFKHVNDVAVVGDDAPVALADRPVFRALAEGRRPDRIAKAAALVADIYDRTSPLLVALREGAVAEPDLAVLLCTARDRQRLTFQLIVEQITGRRLPAEEVDGAWVPFTAEVYELLTNHCGWSRDRYIEWVEQGLTRLVHRRGPDKS